MIENPLYAGTSSVADSAKDPLRPDTHLNNSKRGARSMARTVATILSYGMGVESSAILLRWIMSPATRPVI